MTRTRTNVFNVEGQTSRRRLVEEVESTPSGAGSSGVGGSAAMNLVEGLRQTIRGVMGDANNAEERKAGLITPDTREKDYDEDNRGYKIEAMIEQMRQELRDTKLELYKLRKEKNESRSIWGGAVEAPKAHATQKDLKIFEDGAPATKRISPRELETIREQAKIYDKTGNPVWGVPKNKDMKLTLANFSGKETYKGLGCGVEAWLKRFVRQLERAQMSTEFFWYEQVKMDVLEMHLEGKALEYWQVKREEWGDTTLAYAMKCMKENYRSTLSDRQAMAIFDREKPAYRGYKEHLNYLLQVNEAGGGHYSRNVLRSIV